MSFIAKALNFLEHYETCFIKNTNLYSIFEGAPWDPSSLLCCLYKKVFNEIYIKSNNMQGNTTNADKSTKQVGPFIALLIFAVVE